MFTEQRITLICIMSIKLICEAMDSFQASVNRLEEMAEEMNNMNKEYKFTDKTLRNRIQSMSLAKMNHQ